MCNKKIFLKLIKKKSHKETCQKSFVGKFFVWKFKKIHNNNKKLVENLCNLKT